MLTSDTLIAPEKPLTTPALRLAPRRGVPFQTVLAPLQKIARNMFGLDYRSLALMRIGMALCLLWVVYTNGSNMRAFYTDAGVLSRSDLYQIYGEFPGFSLHLADGGTPYIATLFILQLAFALMMLVGYRTRLATIGSYILLLSMQNRHPVLIYGADIVLRVSLFWAMFLPLARRFSMDNLTGRTLPAPNRPYLGIASIAFILQVCAIYTGGALMKVGSTWQVDHTAVAYALALDVYSRPLGRWLSQFGWITHTLTICTLILEKYGPALFILPVFSKWSRLLAVILFAGLQVGFGLCMVLGYFGPIMITLTFAFLPAFFWERIAAPLRQKLASRFRRLTASRSTRIAISCRNWLERERERTTLGRPLAQPRPIRYARFALALARDGVLILLLVVMLLWNLGNIPDKDGVFPNQPRHMPAPLLSLGYTIGLNQRWDMFAPNPQNVDGWFVVCGTLRNGQTVDLMSGASPVCFDRPSCVADSYQSQIWMCYLISYWSDGASNPEAFARYLGTGWNESHSADEQVASIEIDMMYEEIGPGPSRSDTTRTIVWTQWF